MPKGETDRDCCSKESGTTELSAPGGRPRVSSPPLDNPTDPPGCPQQRLGSRSWTTLLDRLWTGASNTTPTDRAVRRSRVLERLRAQSRAATDTRSTPKSAPFTHEADSTLEARWISSTFIFHHANRLYRPYPRAESWVRCSKVGGSL